MTKSKAFLEKAKKLAHLSECNHRHGAILVKGNRILSTGYNKNNFSKLANKYRWNRRKNPWFGMRHAEIELLKCSNTQGSTVYVCRVNHNGDFMYSKPCGMCVQAMKSAGVKTVVYSVSNDTFEKLDLRRV